MEVDRSPAIFDGPGVECVRAGGGPLVAELVAQCLPGLVPVVAWVDVGEDLAGGDTVADEGGGPQFEFTRLNDIKPELIAEATANARASAEQFANDSGARIGGIRSANQGVISISDRDRGSPHVKTVRVVTTVEYFLRD